MIQACPPEWQRLDLYLFRDALAPKSDIVFYIGQSACAFRRVWRHIEDGFKGRSLVGKFVRVNWPRSMNFTVELLDSGCFESAYRGSDDRASHRTAVERRLIETYRPCFNTTWNEKPTPLPQGYKSPAAATRFPRHMGHMVREARVACERSRSDPDIDSVW